MLRRICLILVLLAPAGAARAEPGLLVGVTEDGLKSEPAAAVAAARNVGFGAFRITLHWRPGQTAPSSPQTAELDGATRAARGMSIVLSVFGERAVHAPTTAERRDEYCAFLEEIVRRYPRIRYVAMWNEPNKEFFWQPQFAVDGTSAAPKAYAELLARCWDVLHEARSGIKVIAPSTAPRGNDKPKARSNVSHSPTAFVRALGRAYRESGRDRPIFDIVGHHVHGVHSAERPWRLHKGSGIAQGDLPRLERALAEAFAGTSQPVPGRCVDGTCVPIWWLEAGFQTKPDRDKTSRYTGLEISLRPLPDSIGPVSLDPLPPADSIAPDQATQIVSGLRLAYCQPHVEAYFNFLLWDEARLEGWQSAPYWVDRTPKGSHAAFRGAIREVAGGEVDCDGFREAVARRRGGLETTRTDAQAGEQAEGGESVQAGEKADPREADDEDGSWQLPAAVGAALLAGAALAFLFLRRRCGGHFADSR